jgi:hypothetical protein
MRHMGVKDVVWLVIVLIIIFVALRYLGIV